MVLERPILRRTIFSNVLLALVGCKSVAPATDDSIVTKTPASAASIAAPGPLSIAEAGAEPAPKPGPITVPIELRVRVDEPQAEPASGTADIYFVGDPQDIEATTLTDAYFDDCESLWGAVDPIEMLSEQGYFMAQLICDNGEDFSTRRLETMLVRVDESARSAELVWWGPGVSHNEMGACIDYRVFAFFAAPDGQHIEVRRQSEVIREPEADEFGLQCEKTAFQSELVQTLPLNPVGG